MKKLINKLSDFTGLDIKTILSAILLIAIIAPTLSLIMNLNKNVFYKQTTTEDTKIQSSGQTLGVKTNLNIDEIKINLASIEEEKKKNELLFEDYENNYSKVNIYPEGQLTPSSLITACRSGSHDLTLCDKEIVKLTKPFSTSGKIDSAYLYIKVGVQREGSTFQGLTYYDSIYFFIDDAQKYGGHLLRAQASWIKENSDSTELLFNLKKTPFTTVPYPSNSSVTPINTPNILDQLNNRKDHYIVGFVSTLGIGKIYEMNIGYQGGEINL